MRTLNTLVPTMQKLVEADYWIKRWKAEFDDATMPSASVLRSHAEIWFGRLMAKAEKYG